MTMHRVITAAAMAALLALVQPPETRAQECQGSKPSGGMWASSADLYLDRAQKNPEPQKKRERYNQALKVLREGFEKQPDNPRNYKLAGQVYVGLNRYEAADSMWDRALELWSCYTETLDSLRYNAWVQAFNLGVRYGNQGEIDKAIQAYGNAHTVYDELPQPVVQIGSFYAQKAQTTADPDSAEFYRSKAITAYRKALDALEGASARLEPDQAQQMGRAAAFNLAQLLAFEERYLAAARAYDRFLDLEPDNVTAKSNAAVVLTLGAAQLESEASDLEDAAAKDSLKAMADSLKEVAAGHYEALLAREDLNADEYHNIGTGLARSGMYENAVTAFDKALDLQTHRPNSLEQKALALYSMGRYEDLANVAQKLVERYPLNMNNLAMLANAYRELDRREDALKILERREEAPVEVRDIELIGAEGTYVASCKITNRKLEPETPVELRFDFHDDTGEVVKSETVTLKAPPQDAAAAFEVETEAPIPISGVSYQLLKPAPTSQS